MKLAQIRVEYNQKLGKAEQGSTERAALLDIYYCLRSHTEKRAAIAPMRRKMNAATDEFKPMYQEALTMLETPDKPRSNQ